MRSLGKSPSVTPAASSLTGTHTGFTFFTQEQVTITLSWAR